MKNWLKFHEDLKILTEILADLGFHLSPSDICVQPVGFLWTLLIV